MPAFPKKRPLRVRRTARAQCIRGLRALLIDCALGGVLLVVFALVHHALPRRMAADNGSVPVMAVHGAARTPVRFALPDASAAGATLQTQSGYESEDIRITLRTERVGGAICHVQDIHIRSVENLKTAFANGAYGKGVRAHPLDMADENNAICAINGDYYGVSSESGAVIRNGRLYRDNPSGDTLVLYYDGVMRIVPRAAFDGREQLAAGAYQAWCFGPSLLDDNGGALKEFATDRRISRSNPRTAIGYYEPGHYCFIAIDGRSESSSGMTLAELSSFCESLGLALAYNLDGGQTSVMTYNGKVVNAPYKGGRASSDIIYICEIGGDQ